MSLPSRADLVATADSRLAELLAVADAHAGAPLGDAYLGRTVTDVLTHLSGWHDLFVGWVGAQRAGAVVHFPAAGYTWAMLADLNTALYEGRRSLSPDAARAALVASHAEMLALIATLTDAELEDAELSPWTGGEPLGSVAHECLGAHYEWGIGVCRAAGLSV